MIIQAIIFSKNRAMQLHALLSSMYANCNVFDRVCVIYTASLNHKKSYQLLVKAFGKVEFIEESNFEDDVKQNIKSEYKYTCFFVDDIICYRELGKMAGVDRENILPTEVDVCHSLRLAYDHVNSPHIRRRFNWRKQVKNFAYPLSTDGHIYKTSFISGITNRIQFDNPNKLEAKWQRFKRDCQPNMSHNKYSTIVSIPVNRVSSTATACFGEKFSYDADLLNQRFLAGDRIDWRNMDFTNVRDCHQEIDFKFHKVSV